MVNYDECNSEAMGCGVSFVEGKQRVECPVESTFAEKQLDSLKI